MKVKRMVLSYYNKKTKNLSRILSVLPEDTTIIDLELLPNKSGICITITSDEFEEINDDYVPVDGHIKLENDKFVLDVNGTIYREK